MALITLTSDYGWKDHYLASVKGRFFHELEEPRIVDISHDIQPFNLQETAHIITRAFPSFPKGTVHVILVDENPSKERGLLMAFFKGHYFLLADNGLLSLMVKDEVPDAVIRLDLRNEHLEYPSYQMVRAAAHIFRGGKMELLGPTFKDWVEYSHLNPSIQSDQGLIKGHVVYVDNYGNLITNIHKGMLQKLGSDKRSQVVSTRYRTTIRMVNTYSEGRNEGDLLSLFNSEGYLEVGVYRSMGSHHNGASSLLGLKVGDVINLQVK